MSPTLESILLDKIESDYKEFLAEKVKEFSKNPVDVSYTITIITTLKEILCENMSEVIDPTSRAGATLAALDHPLLWLYEEWMSANTNIRDTLLSFTDYTLNCRLIAESPTSEFTNG